ncbi:mothers against decapentaplegic homolog 6-like isoform X1 [Centruroides sculpturatus]|uniref:mothers against decapentaplegic homolog 6-like isoform X1 n=1 Tax=Centruroides sculpturatus TaxID=218467 RepID=UPI000C6E4AD8|nr:mothers against decapentaplegic homolog 6-like isoform X1 [Centruroides sculpturatus]
MFRSRRSCLIRRLWKRRGTDGQAERWPEDPEDKSAAYAVLKRLKEVHLEALVRAVESRGAEPSDCVPVPAAEARPGRRTSSPHVLCCRLWRWPELGHSQQLKRLACCRTGRDSTSVCCNPYHWSRICQPESPPPPYGSCVRDGQRPPARADESTPSDGGGGGGGRVWCYVAYWEQCTRVGRLYHVYKSSLDIFSQVARGEGLCLSTLAQNHTTSNDSVLKTRDKIGLGLTLTREDDEVWIYNRSEHSLFFNSPALDPPSTRNLTVHKLPPGHSVKVFDYAQCGRGDDDDDDEGSSDGPVDPNAVRVSFAKGWGPRYSRRFVTSCPCWLEILLSVDR